MIFYMVNKQSKKEKEKKNREKKKIECRSQPHILLKYGKVA